MKCQYVISEKSSNENTLKLYAFLSALSLFLSAVEYIIPKPLPFMRIGLANLPLMIALYKMPFKGIMILAVIKTAGQGIISGTLFSYVFLFSFAGTISSSLVMYAVSRIQRSAVSFIGISLSGALASNAAQFILAYFFLFGEGAVFIGPVLFISGTVTGILLGVFAEKFTKKSMWYALLPDEEGIKKT